MSHRSLWLWFEFPRTATIRSHKSSEGIPSNLNPASKEMTSASVELCETVVCFLHIQLLGTNVWLPKMTDVHLMLMSSVQDLRQNQNPETVLICIVVLYYRHDNVVWIRLCDECMRSNVLLWSICCVCQFATSFQAFLCMTFHVIGQWANVRAKSGFEHAPVIVHNIFACVAFSFSATQRNMVGSPKSTYFMSIFHIGLMFCFFPANFLYRPHTHTHTRRLTYKHSQFGNFLPTVL